MSLLQIDGCDMNVRARIVYWTVVTIALLSVVACQSDGDDSTPTPTETAVSEVAQAEVEAEPTVEPTGTSEPSDSLPAIVAQVATVVPTSTSMSRPTRTARPTNMSTPTEGESAVDVDDEEEPTPTERSYTVRTEVPTATPDVPTVTPTVENVLVVPTPRTYTVREGDTIKSIAYFCEVTVADLLAENDIVVEEADRIIPGQVLLVPEAN